MNLIPIWNKIDKEDKMKKIVFIAISFLITFFVFSQTVSEVEPNGCISLVGGSDSYQTLYPSLTLSGSVSLADTEGCLYFEYTDGDEYVEDLYALQIQTSNYYSISLNFFGATDLDIFLMDEDLNILNPDDCGSYYCGITCGSPEIMNVYLDSGTYILGISLASIYGCFDPLDSSYFLTVSPANQPLQRCEVTGLSKAANPFRLIVSGNNLDNVSEIYISGIKWNNYTIMRNDLIKLKKGNSLKNMFPKDGSWVPVTFVNQSGQSTTILYNRTYNMWQEGGF
jgi:hypothetical protein